MLPLLPLRNYSKFVVDYLKSLLKLHNAAALGKVAKSQDGSRSDISALHLRTHNIDAHRGGEGEEGGTSCTPSKDFEKL